MQNHTTQDLIHAYYEAWARQDRDGVRELLADSLDFRSEQDCFEGADSFLERCWQYSKSLTGATFLREVYDEGQAFVVLKWRLANGATFAGAECLRVDAGRIREILVVNNSPTFGELLK